MIPDDDHYSRIIELHAESWDPTYGSGPPSIFMAVVCRRCGALVDQDVTTRHDHFHLAIQEVTHSK